MKRVLAYLTLFVVGIGSSASAAEIRAEIRYDDVVYLDEAHAKPLPLKTRRPVKLTVSRDQSTTLALLEAGHTVWVLGFGDTRQYVETQIRTGKAKGWIDTDALEAMPEEVRADIEDRVKTVRRHKEMIARREVESGMTRNQVQAALGKPDERSRTQEGERSEEQWIYRTYKSIPQREFYYVEGKLFERTYYKKVLAGGKTVTFRNDEVVSIKEEEKSPEAAQPTVILPPPMIYTY